MELTKEIAEKMQSMFDFSIKLSSLFQFILITQPDVQKTFPVTIEDILNINSSYGEIREFLINAQKGEK